jgi:hypothetical protein
MRTTKGPETTYDRLPRSVGIILKPVVVAGLFGQLNVRDIRAFLHAEHAGSAT